MATRKELMARLPSVIAGGRSTDLGTPVISPFSVDKPTSFTDAVEQPLPDMTSGEPVDQKSKAVDTAAAAALFKTTHGSAFDPKSSMDKKKMAAITSLMSKAGSDKLTPNQFAMQIYRTTK